MNDSSFNGDYINFKNEQIKLSQISVSEGRWYEMERYSIDYTKWKDEVYILYQLEGYSKYTITLYFV